MTRHWLAFLSIALLLPLANPVVIRAASKAIRAMRTFTNPELCMMATTSRQEASSFVQSLVKMGWVVRESVTRTHKRGRLPHYRLVRDLGPDMFVDADAPGGLE